MNIVYHIALSILSGVAASVVFLFILSRFRPRIEISPWIARENDSKGKFFAFKIVNTAARACHNVRVEATLARLRNVEGGQVFWTAPLPLKKAHVFEIPRFNRKDTNADYAWRFVTDENLDELWTSDDALIRFRVLATDSVTNFSRAFSKEFRLPRNSVKGGSHHFGRDLRVS